VHTPNTQRGSVLSSPSQVGNSSPTTRISLRRVSNRKPLPQRSSVGSNDANEPVRNFETPRRQRVATAASAIERTPQALNLGHAPPMAQGIPLISPHELPDRIRQVFPYELFNAVQSKCFAAVYRGNDNVVVSAPTGCGKTAVLELAICRVVESHGTGEFKIVYQAPTRSLCAERMRDWQKKFSHLNLPCAELTGDTSQYEMNRVRNASIIVTTPEKWDSITRKWHDHIKLLQMVKLFLIDEIHILKDARGATLEAVISRMKSSAANVRFIALSATAPNSEDIATWLGRDPKNTLLPAHRETFNEDFRPVKLQKHVYGFEGMMNDFAFEKVLDGKLPGLLQKHTGKKPIMVFCFTRKSCENTATILAEWWTRQKVIHRAWPAPMERTAVINKELLELVSCGVAFHHAGLDVQDRGAIEKAFLKGDISVICCTSTLAVGVNLPCHLVVLKGTVGFQDGGLGEYSDLEVMQMLGRAGRPQFDDTAVAIIMTRQDKVSRYKMMVSGQEILESTLHLNLIEHLNSEIGLGTVYSLETARKWLSGTFLSVRMKQNPGYYKLDGVSPNRDADESLRLVCERDVRLLQENRLVTVENRFMCTEYGHAMSRYMVQFDTMKLLLSLDKHAKTEQIVR
jgi:ATP-dependent DNA helicase HFM1/MER3